jgi:hypothetical protein
MHIWSCLWDTKIWDSHKHAKTCVYMIVLICDTKIRDSHKHAKTCVYDRAYMWHQNTGFISTLKHAYMIVLICDTKIRDSHKHAKTCIYWACLWDTKIRDSHKHAKTCVYDRAYVTPKYGIHKHAKTCIYWSCLYVTPKYGILISTLKHAYMIVLMWHQNTGFS